jgi:LEA14-like dessication related protein
LSADALDVVFNVKISNPYGVELPLATVDYALAARSATFLSGAAPLSGTIPAHGARVVKIPARVVYEAVLDAVTGLRLGQIVPYQADLGLSVQAPGMGVVRVPVSHSGEVPIPNVPMIELVGIEWGDVSLQSAAATLKMKLTNTNEFPVDLKKLAYGVQLDGRDVFSGETAKSLSLGAGEAGEIDIPVKVSAARAGLAIFDMVRKTDTGYTVRGATEVGTPFGPISLPFERTGSTGMSR